VGDGSLCVCSGLQTRRMNSRQRKRDVGLRRPLLPHAVRVHPCMHRAGEAPRSLRGFCFHPLTSQRAICMEEFKPLDSLLQMDTRNELWHVQDPAAQSGTRPIRLEDRYASVADIQLPQSVPEQVQSGFNMARNLWVYGWFHYPFYTLASFHAYVCLESALQERWETEGGSAKRPLGLRKLLSEAVARGWLTDIGLRAKEEADRRRRELRDSLPAPLSSFFAGETDASDTQAYIKIVADALPHLRNSLAHGHWIGMPHWSLDHLRLVAELIEQLYTAEMR
jgi:hypothetical protein